MIDPATGWLEIVPIETKRANVVSNIIEQNWLTQYPRPDQVTCDRGKEFMAEFITMCERDYDLTKKPITVRNPQANSTVERVHQTVGNMRSTFDIPSVETCADQILGTFAAIAHGICSAIHTTTRATPMQLVFGWDDILNVPHIANWKYIQSRKQTEINRNHPNENRKCKMFTNQLNKCILVKNDWTSKCGTTSYKGPCPIVKINDNGTAQLRMDNVLDTHNIRNAKPHDNWIRNPNIKKILTLQNRIV